MSGIKIIAPPAVTGLPLQPQPKVASTEKESFGDFLGKAIGEVNDLQGNAAVAQDKLIQGDAAELHQVMIAAEKAGIAFDLLLEIRKRLLDAYQELIRMPV